MLVQVAEQRELSKQTLTQEHREEKRSPDGEELSTPDGDLDMHATRHRGQYALRKLYHESPRLLAVFYTSPTCGPCRTLKPIFNKVTRYIASRPHLVLCTSCTRSRCSMLVCMRRS